MSPNWLLNMAAPLVGVPIHLFFISVLVGERGREGGGEGGWSEGRGGGVRGEGGGGVRGEGGGGVRGEGGRSEGGGAE